MPTLQILSEPKFLFLQVCPTVPSRYVPNCNEMLAMNERSNGCQVVFNYSQRIDFKIDLFMRVAKRPVSRDRQLCLLLQQDAFGRLTSIFCPFPLLPIIP